MAKINPKIYWSIVMVPISPIGGHLGACRISKKMQQVHETHPPFLFCLTPIHLNVQHPIPCPLGLWAASSGWSGWTGRCGAASRGMEALRGPRCLSQPWLPGTPTWRHGCFNMRLTFYCTKGWFGGKRFFVYLRIPHRDTKLSCWS